MDVERPHDRQHGSYRGRSRPSRRGLAAAALVAVATGATGALAQQMSIPGNFAVNSNGAATYDIAIAVPPGTAGMVPSLKLSYSSQNGNGILGVGWTLSGLPSISRCAQTFAQDGVRGAVTFTASDRFCMDGQRLVVVNGGSYGADGTEYRTEVDSYSRIISHGTTGTGAAAGPTWFEVRTKAGQIMQFGDKPGTTDSTLLAANGSARNWALKNVGDTKGNYFTVSYVNAVTTGTDKSTDSSNSSVVIREAYPTRIDYTGNSSTGQNPYNSIQFTYEARPDPVTVYQAGTSVNTTVRLTDIKTYAGATLVSDYKLAYQPSPSTAASEITSITACAADGSCLPATTVTWVTGGTAGTFSQPSVSPPAFSSDSFGHPNPGMAPYLLNGDFNGDGKTDFAFINQTKLWTFLSTGDGTTFSETTSPVSFTSTCMTAFGPVACFEYYAMAGDFNGDGLTDLAFVAGNYTGTNPDGSTVLVLISQGDGTFSLQAPQHISIFVGHPEDGLYFTTTGDFDGDGRTDFAFIAVTELNLYMSNGNGTFSESANPHAFSASVSRPSDASRFFLVGDFNGDGKTDFSFWTGTTGQAFISAGNASCPAPVTSGSITFCETDNTLRLAGVGTPTTNPAVPVAGDFNGDGKTDIGFAFQYQLTSLVSTGDGFFEERYSSDAFGGLEIGFFATAPYTIPGDFNADGKTDFAFVSQSSKNNNQSQLWVFLSMGDGSFQSVITATFGKSFQYPASNQFYLSGGDFNGDGKTDFSFIQGTQQWVFTANGPPADLVASIRTGLGAETWITYQPLTNPSFYTKENDGAKYPLQNIQAPIYVVVHVDTSNGIGGFYSSGYGYNGAKIDLSGRGFLGFHQMVAVDLQTNLLRLTTNLVSFPALGLSAFPCLGLTQSVVKEQLNPDGSVKQVLNSTSNDYTYTNHAGSPQSQSCLVGGGSTVGTPSNASAPYQVAVAATYAQSWDLDGSAIPMSTTTYQYDSYGNPTQVVTSTPDGFSKTTTNTYTNDVTNWFLGRLTSATVSSTTP